jgi:hypothetical protein
MGTIRTLGWNFRYNERNSSKQAELNSDTP